MTLFKSTINDVKYIFVPSMVDIRFRTRVDVCYIATM